MAVVIVEREWAVLTFGGEFFIISVSFSINIASVSDYLMTCHLTHLSVCVCLSVCLSVCRYVRKVYCGKTADWIRMPFGMVSGVG